MLVRSSKFRLRLLGPFSLESPDGHRISIASRKGAALVAMLAVSKDGERARGWLQTQLWSNREQKEANGSLRRELSELRKRLNGPPHTLLICERDRVRLDLSIVSVDIFGADDGSRAPDLGQQGEFLEGFDIPGEENFEEWLREQRSRLDEFAASPVHSDRTVSQMSGLGARRQAHNGSESNSLAIRSAVASSTPPLSMVLLPFTNIGGDPDQEYFADGVTESLTTDLSRIAGSFVIGRNTAFTYKGRAFDLKQVGRELNVRYVLQGSVQRLGNRVRINVQLADAETGAQLWAERFDKLIADLFEAQDEIVSRLAKQLEAQLIEEAAKRSERSQNPSSTEFYFQGRALLNKGWRSEHLAQARGCFDSALELDPGNINAQVGTAMIDLIVRNTYMSDDGPALVEKVEATLLRVLSLAANHAFAHLLFGIVLTSTNRAGQGIAECERALALDRNLAEAHAQIGAAKVLMGRKRKLRPI
jgi:TolB-like protein